MTREEAIKELQSVAVSNALRGKQNRAAGLHWEFVRRAGEDGKNDV